MESTKFMVMFLYSHQHDTNMAPDGDKIRVTARIGKELDTKIHRHYTNVAPAIVEGLELLVSMKEGNKSQTWHQSVTSDTGDLMARIGDMENQIEFLKRQIEIKDSQLDKQAYSLQSLIQVNSALNMKLLPEKTPIYAENAQHIVKEPEITTLNHVVQNEESSQIIETEKAEKPIKKAKHPNESNEKTIFKKVCPHCEIEFETENPDQVYCTTKHQKAAWARKKRAEKNNRS